MLSLWYRECNDEKFLRDESSIDAHYRVYGAVATCLAIERGPNCDDCEKLLTWNSLGWCCSCGAMYDEDTLIEARERDGYGMLFTGTGPDWAAGHTVYGKIVGESRHGSPDHDFQGPDSVGVSTDDQ